MIRNLLYHCYPVRGTIWKWHAEEVSKYRPIWNGRRILVVVVDHLTEQEKTVRDLFAPLEAEILVRPNHRHLHETTHFLEAFGKLESLNPEEITFYAHAKGVSHWLEKKVGVDREGLIRWCQALYTLNLSRPELVDRLLATYASTGAFRQRLRHADTNWLYSGTYFWIKHSVIFSRNWRDIFKERFGVEGYPGRHIKIEESFPLPPEEISANMLYGGYVTYDRIAAWKKELEAL